MNKPLDIWPRGSAAHVSFDVDFKRLYMVFYPHVADWKNRKPSGNDKHTHVSLSVAQARKLRDWLNAYLGEDK